MPALTNPHDGRLVAAARAEQEDAIVLYLVVRNEVPATLDELVAAVARAMTAARGRAPSWPLWDAWVATSFRKVVLRARERDWSTVAARADAVIEDAGLVAVLAPRRRSDRDPVLRRLQALVRPADGLPRGALPDSAPAMLVMPDPSLAMGAGKLLAQVAHAVQMAASAADAMDAGDAWRDAVAAWEGSGSPVTLRIPADRAAFEAAVDALPCVVVTDFGLTEVPSGSRTVLATRPLWAAEHPVHGDPGRS